MNTVVVNGKPRLLGACKPYVPRPGDWKLSLPAPSVSAHSLRPNWSLDIRDQGQRGTCTANGTLEAAGYNWIRDGKPDPVLSRLFLYWVSRVKMEGGDPADDSGCQIRDVLQALRQYGACAESMWRYSDDDVQFTKEPTPDCFSAAAAHKALFFYHCPDLNTIKASIARGWPVIMGFDVPDNFMSDACAATGQVKMPTPGEGFQGGHCMVFSAFDDNTKDASGPNSWGKGWGDDGWFHMPYDFVESGFVSDCWSLRSVQE